MILRNNGGRRPGPQGAGGCSVAVEGALVPIAPPGV